MRTNRSLVIPTLPGRSAVALISALLLAPAAWAQQASSIAGVVRDTSGAVLPGVTVEASSQALIEKVRTVVTDGAGLYNIVELRPVSPRASRLIDETWHSWAVLVAARAAF